MAEDKSLKSENIELTGRLITSVDPTELGKGDFQALSNMRYNDKGIISIEGMTKVNTSAVTEPVIKSGIHFIKDSSSETHLLVQGCNAGDTTSSLYDNTTAVPAQGNFTAFKTLNGTNPGTFSLAPDGNVAFGNGSDLLIWGGNESRCASFIVADQNDQSTAPSSIYDYTDNVVDADSNTYAEITQRYVHIASVRPLKGIKFYISSSNNNVVPVSSIKYWDSTGSWTSVTNLVDNTASGGKTLNLTASMTFDSTESIAKIRYFNNTLAYWYVIDFAGVSANTKIYKCTLDMPIQSIKDLWDGVPRTIASFQQWSPKDQKYVEYGSRVYANDFVATATATYLQLNTATGFITPMDFIVGFTERVRGINLNIVPENTNTTTGGGTLAVSYWNGTAWTAVTGLKDTTAVGGCSFMKTGVLYWEPPDSTSEFKKSITSSDLFYYYRVQYTPPITALGNPSALVRTSNVTRATLTPPIVGSGFNDYLINVVGATTDSFNTFIAVVRNANFVGGYFDYWNPGSNATEGTPAGVTVKYWSLATITNDIYLDSATGIPVQKSVDKFYFPAMFQNRLVLCNNQSDETNTVLIGGANSASIFNGDDTKKMYFGDDREVIAAIPFFSRFSNNFFENLLVFKNDSVWIIDGTSPADYKSFKISQMNGCQAPKTITACDLGFAAVAGNAPARNVVIWQSSESICLWDGSVIYPIHRDIEDVFDQTKSYAIELTMADKSAGFFDDNLSEWHWLWASKGNTTLNMEYVFDVILKKWYTVDRGTGKKLQLGINVIDANNNKYQYGAITTGYLEHLENGQTFDGNDITASFWSGDAPLGGWASTTKIRKIKPIVKSKNTTTNSLNLYHYGDTANTATDTLTFSVADANRRIARSTKPVESIANGDFVFHSFKCSMTTNNEDRCFEPVGLTVFYKDIREDTK